MKLLYNPSLPGEVLFPDFIWKSKSNKVLLTFDDGPNEGTTEIILKTLSDLNIKAIFFMVGNNISKWPSLAREVLAEGHEFGNHTFNHRKIAFTAKDIIAREIIAFNKIADKVFERQTSFFRPPRGRFDFRTKDVLKNFGLKNVLWSLLSYDYKNDLNIVKFATDNFLEKSSLVVLHDSNKSKSIIKDSINYIADSVENRGLEFGKPLECLI